jgi:hypothetical protein
MTYALYYISGSILVVAAFVIFGMLGRPKKKAQPLEVHEKQIFKGGEVKKDIKVEYLTPLVGFLMLFVAIDASLFVFITSMGRLLTPLLYVSVVLFSVLLVGVEID